MNNGDPNQPPQPPSQPDTQPQKGKEAPDPMKSDVGRPEPLKETALLEGTGASEC